MVVEPNALIEKIKNIGGNLHALSALAAMYLEDENPNHVINAKSCTPYFRLNNDDHSLCIVMAYKDIEVEDECMYSHMFNTIKILAH